MKLTELYEQVTRSGPVTAKEAFEQAQESNAAERYNSIYSRLRHGVKVGAFERVEGRRGTVSYRALPGWDQEEYASRRGQLKPEARETVIRMRTADVPATFAEIGEALGVSSSSAHSMYRRLVAEGVVQEKEIADPVEEFRIFGSKDEND